MKIHSVQTCNPLQNIFYIVEYGHKQAFVIDPCDAEMCKKFLRNYKLQLQKIYITHEHADHYSGVEALQSPQVYAGSIVTEFIPITVTHIFDDGDIIFSQDNIELRVILSPGHSPGHMMFELSYNGEVKAIFTGDVLFQGGAGHTRNGSSAELYESVQKLSRYDDSVMIYPGHDYIENNFEFLKTYFPDRLQEYDTILSERNNELVFTNLGQERSINPFVTATRDEFIRLRELKNIY